MYYLYAVKPLHSGHFRRITLYGDAIRKILKSTYKKKIVLFIISQTSSNVELYILVYKYLCRDLKYISSF